MSQEVRCLEDEQLFPLALCNIPPNNFSRDIPCCTNIVSRSPNGVRNKNCGKRHNQRMAQWEYGKDLDYLTYKFKMAGISVLIGSERGTSSTCPECSRRHKPKGRTWNCPNPECSYRNKHRDITGSLMMQVLAYGEKPKYPEQIKYDKHSIKI